MQQLGIANAPSNGRRLHQIEILKAYRLEFGRQTTMEKLVSIFDSGPEVEPSSVAEQRRFWEEWRTEKKQ
jgi:hypothetical protein